MIQLSNFLAAKQKLDNIAITAKVGYIYVSLNSATEMQIEISIPILKNSPDYIKTAMKASLKISLINKRDV